LRGAGKRVLREEGKIGTGPLLGIERERSSLEEMWDWLVFVLSSCSCLHMAYERVRLSTMTRAFSATNPGR
jgi:hypothetical protein